MYTAHIDTLPYLVVTSHALIADLSALLPRYITYQHRDGRYDRKSWWLASRCASRHGPPGRRPKSTQPLTQHTTQYGISPSSATAKYRIQAAASRCLEAHAPPSRSPRLQHAHLLGETSARFRQPLAPRWPPAPGIDGWSNYLPFGNFTAFHARTRAGHVACTARRTRVEACHISTSSARMGHPGLTSHRTSCLFVVAIVPLAGKPRGVRWSCSAFPFFFLSRPQPPFPFPPSSHAPPSPAASVR